MHQKDMPISSKELHQRLLPELWDNVSEYFGDLSDFENMNKALQIDVYDKYGGISYKKAHITHIRNILHPLPFKHLLTPAGLQTNENHKCEVYRTLAKLLFHGLTADANLLIKSDSWIDPRYITSRASGAMNAGGVLNRMVLERGKYGVFDWKHIKNAVHTIVKWVVEFDSDRNRRNQCMSAKTITWLVSSNKKKNNRHIYLKLLKLWIRECLRQGIELRRDIIRNSEFRKVFASLN